MSGRVNLLVPEVRANPYPTYAELRRGPVCQVDPGGYWVLTRYEDVVAAFKNPQVFSNIGMRIATKPAWLGHNPFGDSMIGMDPPNHTRLRTLVNRAFGPPALARLEPRVRAFAGAIVDRLPEGQPTDIVDGFCLPLPASVIGELIGLDPTQHLLFKRWADDLTSISAIGPKPESETPRMAEIRATVKETEQYMSKVLASRRVEPRDDLVTDLINARVDGEALTDAELMNFMFLLLVAGLETTIHLMSHSMRILMERPELVARLKAEPSRIPRFVEEVLRYEPPVQAIMRVTTGDTEIRGVTIPKGSPVALMIGAANHDDSHFPRADSFDMDREGTNNLPFGHGVHFCLGAPLARMEARLGLEALLARFSRFTPAGPLEWNRSMTVRGPVKMPVVAHAK
ncbi:cytochrome P450 [Pyxidicoccus fallax]|uniref:Cytochrome P450 n=1 Tax=Pyxidicoccus fallax TaxID=394095 RepID=A0A848LKW7_9BACT|nr:cytochrome P450 [Pyxidicoccus fallax]NMO18323.1 cytochrome P450 [Pyxidicoccus fallax]NPC85338.1 cytochrome P450 [Pyxidicoccus fallax]